MSSKLPHRSHGLTIRSGIMAIMPMVFGSNLTLLTFVKLYFFQAQCQVLRIEGCWYLLGLQLS